MKNEFYIWLIICIITHIVRSIYEIYKTTKNIKISKFGFVLLFINMFLLWASWFSMCEVDVYKLEIPGIIKYTGLGFVIFGAIVFFVSLFTIKSLESFEGGLITKGIYAVLRHPMYFSFILWIIGFSVFQRAFVSFSLSPIFILNILFWRYNEEKLLIKKYREYLDYKKKTFF